jgi:hypothetical protein
LKAMLIPNTAAPIASQNTTWNPQKIRFRHRGSDRRSAAILGGATPVGFAAGKRAIGVESMGTAAEGVITDACGAGIARVTNISMAHPGSRVSRMAASCQFVRAGGLIRARQCRFVRASVDSSFCGVWPLANEGGGGLVSAMNTSPHTLNNQTP